MVKNEFTKWGSTFPFLFFIYFLCILFGQLPFKVTVRSLSEALWCFQS